MIVPKEHMDSIEDFSASEYQEAMNLVRKVVDKAKKGLGADGVSVTMNIDEAAGQMVPHAYIQVFPRFEDEETAGTPTGAVFQPHEEAKKNLDSIKEKMAAVDSSFGETTKEPHPDSQNFKEEKPSRDRESGSSDSSDTEVRNRKSGSEGEAIDQLAGQLEGSGGSPLSLGGGSGSGSKQAENSSGGESAAESGKREEEEKDEVRLDEDFEAKSFDWH